MNRYSFLHNHAKKPFAFITKGSHWLRNDAGRIADREYCRKMGWALNSKYPSHIEIYHDEPNAMIPYSEPRAAGWYVGNSIVVSTEDILAYYNLTRLCRCGHPEEEHADVPGISKDACWSVLECNCEKFHE